MQFLPRFKDSSFNFNKIFIQLIENDDNTILQEIAMTSFWVINKTGHFKLQNKSFCDLHQL